MKKLIKVIVLNFVLLQLSYAQQTLTESLGTGANGTSIAAHEAANGFDQDDLTYSGSADLRTTSLSSNGGFNVMFNASGENFIIGGLLPNMSCTSIDISFLVGKNTNADNGNNFIVEYSTTGTSGPWTSAGTVTLPTGTGTTTGTTPPTYYSRSFDGLPSTILAFRFRSNNTVEYRLDLITITGNGTGCVIPVVLTSFTVKATPVPFLEWQTATERNNSHFEVERSTDGVTFEKIGEVAGKGNSTGLTNYTFEDKDPLSGVNYYRLRQVDFDGAFEYSAVRSVVFGSTKKVTVFPAPVASVMTVQLDEAFKNDAQWQITDMSGRLVSEGVFAAEQNQMDIPVNGLVEGVYVLRIVAAQETITRQFRKI
jgi:hypothetical protein